MLQSRLQMPELVAINSAAARVNTRHLRISINAMQKVKKKRGGGGVGRYGSAASSIHLAVTIGKARFERQQIMKKKKGLGLGTNTQINMLPRISSQINKLPWTSSQI